MKKNTFKPTDIKYAPIDMSQPMRWMAEVEKSRYTTRVTTIKEIIAFTFLLTLIALSWAILG